MSQNSLKNGFFYTLTIIKTVLFVDNKFICYRFLKKKCLKVSNFSASRRYVTPFMIYITMEALKIFNTYRAKYSTRKIAILMFL